VVRESKKTEVGMQHQTLRRRLGTLAGAALVLVTVMVLSPLPLSAHHGWGGYMDAEFEISGTVETPVSVAGPHASMKIKADDGHVWDVVLAPPFRTEQAGLKEGIIPVGAKITAHGHRHRDAKKFEIKTERVTWNGKVFNVYPDRS
jgi:uncharacterized protein DUF6152